MKPLVRTALTIFCATIVLSATWITVTLAQTYLMRRPVAGLLTPGSTPVEAAPPTSAVDSWPQEILCRHASLPGRRYLFRMTSFNTTQAGDLYIEYVQNGGFGQLAWSPDTGNFCAACSEGNSAGKVGCYGVHINDLINNPDNGARNADGSAATAITF